MQLGLSLEHHDHAYVERRGGHELWSHMRAGRPRARFRLAALVAADARYQACAADGDAVGVAGGIGLLVLQRAMLAAEDLGCLLYTLAESPSWSRFNAAKLDDLDATYAIVMTDPHSALAPFVFPDSKTAADEPGLTDLERTAMLRLSELTAARTLCQLEIVARLWLQHRAVAKATMHGFPIVAGAVLDQSPGGGKLAEVARPSGVTPWALAVISRADHQSATVTTDSVTLDLDADAVSSIVRAGKAACKCAEWLCAAQSSSIESGHAHTLSLALAHRLSSDERTALETAVGRRDD